MECIKTLSQGQILSVSQLLWGRDDTWQINKLAGRLGTSNCDSLFSSCFVGHCFWRILGTVFLVLGKFEELSVANLWHLFKVSYHVSQNWSVKLFTVLCKSNSNDNQWILRFVLAISRWYISDKSQGLANAKTINQRDIGTIFAISHQDIGLARICCNDISQSETIYSTMIYHCSKVRCNNISWWTLLQRFIVVKRVWWIRVCVQITCTVE